MLRTFNINIVVRILILIVLMLAFNYCFVYTDYVISMIVLLALFIAVIWDLIRYSNQTNRDITTFLMGIKYDDFSLRFSGDKKGKSFQELYTSFNQINSKFLEIRAEKEAQYQYLQNIVDSAEVGLLCINSKREVILMNNQLKKILAKPYLISLESLKSVSAPLYESIKDKKHGERELLKINLNNRLLQLSIQISEFTIQDDPFRLFSIQNIQSELEERDLQAWQKLIRILTHEIMNSVTPIISLSGAMNDSLSDSNASLTERDIKDLRQGIGAIKKRSEGLLHFTDTYRKLTKIPPPNFQLIEGIKLLERLHTLFKPNLKEKNIEMELILPRQPLRFQADPELMEQVLINLIKNAIDAFENQENPKIQLILSSNERQKINIQIADNGPGIPEDILDQIFVPFFTTKAEGSGVGLSLCRQIIQMHQGQLTVESKPELGTVFTIQL